MSRTEQQPRHLDPGAAHRARVRWVSIAGLVVAVVLLILSARVLTQPTQVTAVSVPASTPAAASAALRPVLSDECRMALAAATRMIGRADGVATGLRAHKKLMDDYKSGRIDRVAALPQGSPWRQALARTLKNGVAAASQYDADKATYRELAARCSRGG